MKYERLTPEEERVIIGKGTEPPFSGKYHTFFDQGTYMCKRCRSPLFRSTDKLASECGWPSFDAEIPGAVRRVRDADGRRTEIICAACGAHLGHVFLGEGFTPKETRHCVNSISLVFVPVRYPEGSERAVFASGCFWGTQFHFQKVKGVLGTTVGFIGGHTPQPTYEDVCRGNTGHAEAVEVFFDPKQTSFEELTKLFFETHDFSQLNRQGPDIGEQYRSEIFVLNEQQYETAAKLIRILQQKGYRVATRLTQATTFWKAEADHQDYYQKRGGIPYCHIFRKIF